MVEAFTLLSTEMEACVLEQPDEDPKEWMHKLDQINIRLATVGGQGADYSKSSIQKIDHIINKLPAAQYKHFTTAYVVGGMLTLNLNKYKTRSSNIGEKMSRTKMRLRC